MQRARMTMGGIATSTLALALSSGASAQPVITNLGVSPGASNSMATAVSADGSAVVGLVTTVDGPRAFRWTQSTGLQLLGVFATGTGSAAQAVNADGSVVVGWSNKDVFEYGLRSHAFRWSQAAGMIDLSGVGGNDGQSWGEGVSADGSVVVGYGYSPPVSPMLAVVSKQGGAFTIVPGALIGSANAISDDGLVIAGKSNDHAFRWTQATGIADLGVLPGTLNSSATAVNTDGSVVVGRSGASLGFRWTAQSGMQDLGFAPGTTTTIPDAVTADGLAVVGRSILASGASSAFFWTPSLGMVDLNGHLTSLGVDLTGWVLREATGISADGSVIVGSGEFNGETRAWIVTGLTDMCDADCDGNGSLSIDDFICFQTLFALGEPAADCDEDGNLTIDDFICFQTIFAIGC